jgi:hypothetical protein
VRNSTANSTLQPGGEYMCRVRGENWCLVVVRWRCYAN